MNIKNKKNKKNKTLLRQIFPHLQCGNVLHLILKTREFNENKPEFKLYCGNEKATTILLAALNLLKDEFVFLAHLPIPTATYNNLQNGPNKFTALASLKNRLPSTSQLSASGTVHS